MRYRNPRSGADHPRLIGPSRLPHSGQMPLLFIRKSYPHSMQHPAARFA